MDLQTVAARHKTNRSRIARAARLAVAREWRKVDPHNIRASYQVIAERILRILVASQHRAASESNAYLAASLQAQGADNKPTLVNAAALAGVASDGRDLASLVQRPVVQSLLAIQQGATPRQALAYGGVSLDRITGTQTFDAGRIADGVGIAATPVIRGYLRFVAVPCCSRCAILAGRFYRWSSGFERHPNCDCSNVPLLSGTPKLPGQDPMELFRNGDIRNMSKADVQAVKDGADLNQVVNAHRRGMATTVGGRKVTRESTTRRGVTRGRSGRRLMPEQIYKEAKTRDEAIALLRANGFIF